MIAIIGAMDLELELLFRDFVLKNTIEVADKKFFLGEMYGKSVAIAKSGIGKVNAAMTATILCAGYDIKSVLNIGVAGGIPPCVSGDIILADAIGYFDVSLSEIDDVPYGKMGDDPLLVLADPLLLAKAEAVFQQMDIPYRKGTIVSGDQFVMDSRTLEPIKAVISNIVACEMEGMAIAMVCAKFRIPFLSIRGVSDVLGEINQGPKYKASVKEIARNTTGFLMEFLRN